MTNIGRPDSDDLAQEAHVAAVLSAATAPVEPGPLPGEHAALAAFRDVHRSPGRKRMRSLVPFKTGLAAAVGASVLLTGGVAAAATGHLPDAAQQTAKSMLDHVGITVPGPNDHAGDHPGQRGTSAGQVPSTDGTTDETGTDQTGTDQTGTDQTGTDQTGTDQTSTDQPDSTDGQGKGSTISELARSKDTSGIQKGMAVSTVASGGQSQAGQHGQATTHPTSTDHPTSTNHPSSTNHPGGAQPGSTDTGHGDHAGSSGAGAQHSAGGTSHRP